MKKVLVLFTMLMIGTIGYSQSYTPFTRMYSSVESFKSATNEYGDHKWISTGKSFEFTEINFNVNGTSNAEIVFQGGERIYIYSVLTTGKYSESGTPQFQYKTSYGDINYGFLSDKHCTIIIGDTAWTFYQ